MDESKLTCRKDYTYMPGVSTCLPDSFLMTFKQGRTTQMTREEIVKYGVSPVGTNLQPRVGAPPPVRGEAGYVEPTPAYDGTLNKHPSPAATNSASTANSDTNSTPNLLPAMGLAAAILIGVLLYKKR